MNRGRRREEIFSNDKDRQTFLKLLSEITDLYKIEIHAYALLPNHYHLLIHTPEGNLSRCMRHLNGVYTQKYNYFHKTDGSLFRGRYKAIVVDKEEYLLELIRYIHRNPLRAKLEKVIGQYQWCSHGGYMSDKSREEWLHVDEVLVMFSKYEKEARRKLKTFVDKEVPKDLMKRLESVNWPVVLGGKDFKEEIKKLYRGKDIDIKEVPDYRKKLVQDENGRKEIDELINNNRDILNKKRNKTDIAKRRALIYVLRREYMLSIKEISRRIGGITSSAVSKHYKKAEEDMTEGTGAFAEVERLIRGLKFIIKT